MNGLWVGMFLAATPYLELREEARAVLSVECGGCHTRGLPTAKPAALGVFDLTRGNFADGLTEAQMASVRSRLAGTLKESAQPRSVSADDQRRVAEFLEAELARRRGELPDC